MAQDEGFTDVSNGDDLNLGPSESTLNVEPTPSSKQVHRRNNNSSHYNPITSFTSPTDSTQSEQTACKFNKLKGIEEGFVYLLYMNQIVFFSCKLHQVHRHSQTH